MKSARIRKYFVDGLSIIEYNETGGLSIFYKIGYDV